MYQEKLYTILQYYWQLKKSILNIFTFDFLETLLWDHILSFLPSLQLKMGKFSKLLLLEDLL